MSGLAKDVLIIGGGAAGMACATRLTQLKNRGQWKGGVKLIEKTDELGGRLRAHVSDEHYFDLGAQQCQAATTRSWKTVEESLRRLKMVSRWGRVVHAFDCTTREMVDISEEQGAHYTLSPSCRVLEKFVFGGEIASSESIFISTEIDQVQRWERDQWIYRQTSGKWMRSDILVIACPPQAILPVFIGSDDFPLPESPLIEAASKVAYHPLLTFAVGWKDDGVGDFDILRVTGSPCISSIYNNSTKDGRPKSGALTIVATPEYTQQMVQEGLSRNEIMIDMGKALQELPFVKYLSPPTHGELHLWPQGYHTNTAAMETLYDSDAAVALCGDWTQGANTVERAWVSGVMAANQIAGFSLPSEDGHHGSDFMHPVTQAGFKRTLMKPVEERTFKPYVSWDRE